MQLIEQITTDARQQQTLVLPDGSSLTFTMYFVPMQFGWFFTDITYGDVIIKGRRIFVSPNMLYQFKNQIPFGIACFSKNSREPTLQQDFASGSASLYLLTAAEVALLTEAFENG